MSEQPPAYTPGSGADPQGGKPYFPPNQVAPAPYPPQPYPAYPVPQQQVNQSVTSNIVIGAAVPTTRVVFTGNCPSCHVSFFWSIIIMKEKVFQ